MKQMKIVFVRPPYHLWPIINESDNFLLPLGFPCLAAYLREKMDNIEVSIIDCLPEMIGWRTLERKLAELKPDVVGIGDKAVYMNAGIRVLRIAKKLDPSVITVAGGHFHSHMPEFSLSNFPELDYIVRYEGEETLRELLETLRQKGDLKNIKSLAFRDGNGGIICTPFRKNIENLDDLPIPAYDLTPMDRYAPFGLLWPKAAPIQRGRGCPDSCNFCSWTALEGEHEIEDGRLVHDPTYRTKSVDRVISEIEHLHDRFGVRYLFWVDGTWNLDHEWMEEFCDKLIPRRYNLGWWAFVRADLMIEQEKLGILEKMVKAGLRHVLIGGERPTDDELNLVGKTDYSGENLARVCQLLKKKYPEVFRQSTFLTGIRTETMETMDRLGEFSRRAGLDFAAFHPIMPFPGTPLWEEAKKNGWIEEMDFDKFDMFYPVMPSEFLDREAIAGKTQELYLDFVKKQFGTYLASMFSPYAIRRKLHWWFAFSIGRVMFRDWWLSITGKKQFEGFAAVNKLWKPSWYDS